MSEHDQVGPDSEQLTPRDLGITSGPFADAVVIHTYGLSEAVRDGVLVLVDAHRVSAPNGRPVLVATSNLLSRLPRVEDEAAQVKAALTEAASMAVDPDGDAYLLVAESVPAFGGAKVWLCDDGGGHYTAMLPEDY